MITALHPFRWSPGERRGLFAKGWLVLCLSIAAFLPSACMRLSPPEMQPDVAAEQILARLRQTNLELHRFKCVGKITISGPNRPVQVFRAAMAGRLPDRLRIDMFIPFGGTVGSISSDGTHLFLVMPPSREYYKTRLGNGSLRRLMQMNVTLGDLLDLLMGRIPVDSDYAARLMRDQNQAGMQLALVDRWGKIRQRIALDACMQAVRSERFDDGGDPTCTFSISGRQEINGFILPMRLDLCDASGQKVSVELSRYEANARMDDGLFTLPSPS